MAVEELLPMALEVGKALWDKHNTDQMNAYNSPKAQVKRLQEAGINPAWAMANPSIDSGNQGAPSSAPNLDEYASQRKAMKEGGLMQIQARGMELDNELKRSNIEAQDIANHIARTDEENKSNYWKKTLDQIDQAIKNGKASQALAIAQKALTSAQTGVAQEQQNKIKSEVIGQNLANKFQSFVNEHPYWNKGRIKLTAELAGALNQGIDLGLIHGGSSLSGRFVVGMEMTPDQFAYYAKQVGARINKTINDLNKPKPRPANKDHWWNHWPSLSTPLH